ncbi:DNA-binding transcriptional LysR family regulator [Spinactinospora alkalitolerans]|uniref:DNA-binding transcriptional LysR family regulator n=1 Tax=Spinactinospora alkalitolerans TaxID=687207 RepID=A0A852TUI9_9ACTN|nr:LysR family transcriptional regulator [Spinactinospora alkalitolerans]NYE47699.1 DNA-binding transcriptional LysR family regulator [Spinactinospora alkalitolerans]
MDLSRHLGNFLAVAEELHFTRAAEVLGMAQPPLSQSIRRLERELGVALFDRGARQVELTTAGQLLVAEAREFVAREERLRALMRQARDGELGTLRAGVPPETSAVTLRALMAGLAERAPELTVDLAELTTAEQVRGLASGQLDVGLVHAPVDATDLRAGPAVQTVLGAVLPRTSPLARARELELADLAGHELIAFPRAAAPGAYDRLLALCRDGGFSPARVRHARNPEFVLGLVLAGQGVAFEEERMARREPRVAWRPLAGTPLLRRVTAVWPDQSPHPTASRFAAIAADVLCRDETATVPLTSPSTPRPWSVVYTPP